MENQSEKLDHQVAGLPSLCLASSRIQFSVHTGSVARIAIKSGACARRALGHRQMLRGLNSAVVRPRSSRASMSATRHVERDSQDETLSNVWSGLWVTLV